MRKQNVSACSHSRWMLQAVLQNALTVNVKQPKCFTKAITLVIIIAKVKHTPEGPHAFS
jgi:hypothetical protein